jgi:superfamily II DNA or RNA helicase
MRALLEAIRKAALPGIWSQGVKLARAGAVGSVSSRANETTVRVRAPGLTIAPTVTLYSGDIEWTCDCDGRVDPCAHVAAAVIACEQSQAPAAPGDQPPGAGSQADRARPRLVYRLGTRDRALTLTCAIVHADGRDEPLSGGLTSELARGRLPAELTPTHENLLVDRIMSAHTRGVVPLPRIGEVLEALSSAELTLAGTRVRSSGERVTPRAVVEDEPSGELVLKIERDPRVSDVVAMGVVRLEDVLHPIGEAETTGQFLERLPLIRAFPRDRVTELVTEVLPELEKKIPVEIRTARLPGKARDVVPRIAMDLSHHGHTLSVLPLLVYGDPPIARVDGNSVVALGGDVPIRRLDEERALLRKLRDELDLVPGRRVDLDDRDAVRFAQRLRNWQRKSGEARHAEIFEGQPLGARIELAGGQFDVLFESVAGTGAKPRRASAESVLRAWRDGLELVPLDGGGWAPLPLGWLAEHGQRVLDLLAARDGEKKLSNAVLPELGALCAALDLPKPLGLDKLAPLLDGFAGIPHADLPAGVTAELRSYQKTGVDWLAFLREAELGGVLADDMGLGKTLQTLCALDGRTLVVCPKSVVYNWADEIARFRPGLRTSIYAGPERTLDPAANVTLATYAVLRMDAERLAGESWDAIVLDEAQAIKNPESQTARAAFGLRARFRVALSGTPIENRLDELWSIMRFANPGLLGGRSDFQERYTDAISAGRPGAAERLRAKVRPFVLRRMKREVLPELPARTEAVLHVELEPSEREVYDAVRAATKREIAEKLEHGGGVMAALEALLRLRQASCHSELVPGQHAETSSKIERLLETLEEAIAEGHKALVFSQWTSLLDLAEPHLKAAGIEFTRLDGSTRDRAAVVGQFQAQAGPPVMLISLKAGGTGLNLTAADHVFLLDPWWNPAVEDQAADRAHRIGQDRPVMIYRMVAKDTVEERVLALQAKKRGLAEAALGNADHAGGITRAELLALLD